MRVSGGSFGDRSLIGRRAGELVPRRRRGRPGRALRLARGLGLGLVLGAGLSCGAGPAAPPPDVLLVILDTARADRLEAAAPRAGGPSPWRELVARGTNFTQAVAPSSWTLPSMAALFAGRDVRANRHAAFARPPALAERFAAGGWRTVAIVANPLLTRDNGFARGFQAFDVAPAAATADLAADLRALRAWDADALVARALEALRETSAGQPAFVYLHLMDAHIPYDPAHDALAAEQPGWSSPPLRAWSSALNAEQERFLAGWRRAYDGQLLFASRALLRLAERAAELRGRPVVLAIAADHGEGLFDHARAADSPPGPGLLGAGYGDHGEQVHEEALRVPLLLIGPGVAPGRVEPRQVALTALGPTLLRLAGLAGDGTPLPLRDDDPAIAEVCGAGTRSWFVRTEAFKLVVPFPERGSIAPQLFEQQGAGWAPEVEDRAAVDHEPAAQLARVWSAWMESLADDEVPAGPDPETEARLRALGYLR